MEKYVTVRRRGTRGTAYVRVNWCHGYADVEVVGGQWLYARNLPVVLQHIAWAPAPRDQGVYLKRRKGMSGCVDYIVGTVEVPGRTWADSVTRLHVTMSGKVRRVVLAGSEASVLVNALREDWGEPDREVEVEDFTPLPLRPGVQFFPAETEEPVQEEPPACDVL